MVLTEYDQIIRENFDLSDKNTRKYLVSLNESDENKLLSSLANALYEKIVNRVEDIDFGTIPKSRGDITKVDGFENTVKCLNIIRNIVNEYKENPVIVDTVITSIENLKKYSYYFMKAYSNNIDFPKVLYNLMVMAIEQSVSFMIAVTIQYIKDPASQNLKSALDKAAYNNMKSNVLYIQLDKFNASCITGEVEDILKSCIKNGAVKHEAVGLCPKCNNLPCICNECDDPENMNPFDTIDIPCPGSPIVPKCDDGTPCEPVNGCGDIQSVKEGILGDALKTAGNVLGNMKNRIGDVYQVLPNGVKIGGIGLAIAGGAVIGFKLIKWIIKVCIPLMRSITFFCINTRVKISDNLNTQAQFIELNAYKLQYSDSTDLDDEHKQKVIDKQMKIAAKLKSIANFLAIDNKNATNKTDKDIAEEDKSKFTIDDTDSVW